MCNRSENTDGLEFDADCRNTFWVEAPLCLLTGIRIREPWEQMTLEERMNNITRVVLVVFVIMMLAKVKHAQTFLIVALLLIIILYYAKRRRLDQLASKRSLRKQIVSDSVHSPPAIPHINRHHVKAAGQRAPILESREERFMATAGKSAENDPREEDNPEVEARQQVRGEEKRNPRRPYPPTVPADLVVKAGNQHPVKTIGKVFNPDPNLTRYVPKFGDRSAPVQPPANVPRYQQGIGEIRQHSPKPWRAPLDVNPKTRQVDQQPTYPRKNDTDFDEERGKYLNRSFQGGPRSYSKRQGYQVQEFQDEDYPPPKAIKQPDDEDSDLEAEDIEEQVLLAKARRMVADHDARLEVEQGPVISKVANPAVSTSRPKKTFLPSNYEVVAAVQEIPTPHKINAYGAGRRIRKVAKWSDNNGAENRIDAADIMYKQAEKLEKTVKARYRIDRESHINSILSV